jgi:glycosyl transferase family 2
MRVAGVSLMRDEEDIVALNLLFHLSLGIDEILVIDNGSSDSTLSILRRLAKRTGKVRWSIDSGTYRQHELTTGLAREAARRGADWIMVIDADEFWQPSKPLKQILVETAASVLMVPIVNFIQRRAQRTRSPDQLLHMTRRVESPVGPVADTRHLVESRSIAFVEMEYPPKCITRASDSMDIHPGNHKITGVEGSEETTNAVRCLHAPLRSFEVLRGKVEQGRRVEEARVFPPTGGWHVKRWRRLAQEGELDAEWNANSYEGNALDVFGQPHALAVDERLREAVGPFVESSLAMSRSGRTYFDFSRLRSRR